MAKQSLFKPRMLLTLMLVGVLGLLPGHARSAQITVFAAASLKDALEQIATEYEAQAPHRLRLSLAGSATLARQIQYGAPADVFVSANPDWMDWLADQGLIDPAARADLLRNRLVLIAPVETPAEGLDFGDGRLAMALVDAVPAGIYGKTALESLDLWPDLAPRVVQADNVRAALALVALGEATRGIVYRTDAMAEPKVRILAEFPPGAHPPILYPVAPVAGPARAEVTDFLQYLQSPAAWAVFARFGFLPPEGTQ